MIWDFGIRISDWERPSTACAPSSSTIHNPQSASRNGLTLIELLVVIVILTTLVGGVIPVLSPNNDTRKIREASRMLQTYIHMAQAEAARTGRSHGIAFQESATGSGVALEVNRLEVPESFRGFSSHSRVVISLGTGSYAGLIAQYSGFQLYDLEFVLAGTPALTNDPFPPRMLKIGDQVSVEGNVFLIVDDPANSFTPYGTAPNVTELLDSDSNLVCIWLNDNGQVLPITTPPTLKRYEIIRQPANSPEPPMQLPAAIAIDMQGSVVEGSSTGGFPADNSLFIVPPAPPPPPPPNTVGIMFSPNGSVSNVFLNGNTLTNVSRIVLLLGRVENGGLTGGEWSMSTGDTDEQISQKQEQINWLNLDSRWLSIAANSGRVVVTENAFISPTKMSADGLDPTLAEEQIEAAHEFAHEMRRGGGG